MSFGNNAKLVGLAGLKFSVEAESLKSEKTMMDNNAYKALKTNSAKYISFLLLRALEVALVYGVVALVPVLWITFSAIDVSFAMISTRLLYGFVQSFAAGIVFAKLNP